MKMTLKRFCISLAVLASAQCFSASAWSLQQMHKYTVIVDNMTDRSFELCVMTSDRCDLVNAKGDVPAWYDGDDPEKFVTQWVSGREIRVCGKVIPLGNVMLPPVGEKRHWWGSIRRYRIAIPADAFLKLCS